MQDVDIINAFEEKVAKYAGSHFGVAVSSGTNGIFLALKYLNEIGEIDDRETITIPKRTYLSVPMSILNVGLKVKFKDIKWSGAYQLQPTRIYDSAVKFTKDMYIPNSLYVVSFQYRKALPIGRGGMILTNSQHDYNWLKQVRHDGKHPGVSKWDDKFYICGWDMYMLPEQAARGLTLFNMIAEHNLDICSYKDYPDVSKQMKMI